MTTEQDGDYASQDVKTKRVLVTGAGTGIGRGIALAFAKEGATVALHYSHSADGAVKLVQNIKESGGRAETFAGDFTLFDDVARVAAQARAFLGGIDVLVNNAGITMTRPFRDVSLEQFDTLYSVNVRAPFFLTQNLLPDLLQSSAPCIINITSIHAFEGRQEHSVYAGTRGAMVSFTRQLAVELAPMGVRVNAIAPGSTEVENQHLADPDFDPATAGRSIPVGFIGQPEDVGNVAVFLASDKARYIVGQTLIVDGGTTSWMPFSGDFRSTPQVKLGKRYVPGM